MQCNIKSKFEEQGSLIDRSFTRVQTLFNSKLLNWLTVFVQSKNIATRNSKSNQIRHVGIQQYSNQLTRKWTPLGESGEALQCSIHRGPSSPNVHCISCRAPYVRHHYIWQ